MVDRPERCLVTGAGGQLGRALTAAAAGRGMAVVGLDRAALDVADESAVRAAVESHAPDVVFHTAAATKVDRCETEVEWAEAVNARAPGHVAAACAATGAVLVHYSTDFVFDGTKGSPYVEDDPQNPLSVYGRTKAEGERAVALSGHDRALVLRTQWVYGPGGRCFPAAILEKARAGDPLSVVDDQVGSPTMTEDLAALSLDLVARCVRGAADFGTYHAANDGVMSWYDFACLVLRHAGLGHVEVQRIQADALGLPAPRPAYSALDTGKLRRALGAELPGVESGLERYLRAESALAAAANVQETEE